MTMTLLLCKVKEHVNAGHYQTVCMNYEYIGVYIHL